MKKFYQFLISICSVFLIACNASPKINKSIEIKEMREIAELATVECYFHNVAKSDKDLNPAWYELWAKKNMRFWVEYDGIVKIGIDISKLKVEVDGTTVKITLPEAEVLDASVNQATLTEENFYYDPNAKKPNADEQKEAFKGAQDEMKASAQENYALMASARDNAKELLENYVKTIGKAIGTEYTIEWIYLESAEE